MFDSKVYKETFSQVHASEETLSEVLNMTKRKQNTGARVTRMVVIAAVITVLLATTVFAYVGFTRYENPMELLETFFGGEERSSDGQIVHETYYDQEYDYVWPTEEHVPLDEVVAQEQVAPYVSGVGESVTHGDYTLTVEAHLYDSATDCGIIYYTLENPNGVRGYQLQYDGEVWWPAVEPVTINNCFGKNFIIEEETNATRLSVAHYYSSVYGDERYIRVQLAGEPEELYLPLDDGGGMDSVTLAEGGIRLSAIGISIDAVDMEFLRRHDTDGTYLPPMVDNIESLVIRFQHGSEYVLYSEKDDQVTANYKYCIGNMVGDEITYSFNRLIDTENVEAVIINDVEFTDVRELTSQERAQTPEAETELPPVTEPANP